jgi:alkanesulfonate monooxygenase SsuD/methylene tetrahydromethanopterin reductase-like flavin-dependent oxidoreductase (luciferase family)
MWQSGANLANVREDAMKVGSTVICQNYQGRENDQEMYRSELKVADLTEPLGFDSFWTPEHHFDDYSIVPNPLTLLAWVAARTSRIQLGTAAVILPWHNPLRVAVEASMVDTLSNGRLLLGFGRGLSRMEYEQWQIDMNGTRDYFNESAKMIIKALETGVAEYDGTAIKQAPAEIRPRPLPSLKDRIHIVAGSTDSVPVAAELGAVMMMFSQVRWEKKANDVAEYRRLFRQHHGRDAKPVVTLDFVYCDADGAKARATADRAAKEYFATVVKHYEMDKGHFAGLKGYQFYAKSAEGLQKLGLDKVANDFAAIQASGTPDEILRNLEARRAAIGDYDLNCIFRFSGLTDAEVEGSMRLFAKEVLPVVQSWQPARIAAE